MSSPIGLLSIYFHPFLFLYGICICFYLNFVFIIRYSGSFHLPFFLEKPHLVPNQDLQRAKTDCQSDAENLTDPDGKGNPGFKPLSRQEYRKLTDLLEDLDVDGFVQEQDDNEILWIPDFNRDNPFPEGFAKVLPLFLEFKSARGL